MPSILTPSDAVRVRLERVFARHEPGFNTGRGTSYNDTGLTGRHQAEVDELVWPQDQAVWVQIGDERIVVQPGDAVLWESREWYEWSPTAADPTTVLFASGPGLAHYVVGD